jgi:hypothetical protein
MGSIRHCGLRFCTLGFAVLLAACSSGGGGGGGGGTASLSGSVLGPGLTGLPGVVVQVAPATTLLGGGSTTKQAVTDAGGNFIILGSPTGMVDVHIDGSGVAGGTFASLELRLAIGAGASVLPQAVVLPNLDDGTTMDVGVDVAGMTSGDATIGDPMVDGYGLEILDGTTILVDGEVPAGGMVAINVTPVPSADVPMPLPGTLDAGSFVTIQPPGATFSPALSITLPNTDGLPLGTLVDIWSFDHDLGTWVNRSEETGNQGVVTDIGGTTFVVANAVITEGGWHSSVIEVDVECATTIQGQVFIQGSAAVPLANVAIALSTGQFALTGADGRFSIPSVPAYDASLLQKFCMASGIDLRAIGPVSHGANQVLVPIPAGSIVTGGTTVVPAFDMPVSMTGSVVGSVTDAQGFAVDGTVEITGPANVSVQTLGGGFFAGGLAPGDYSASFTFASSLVDAESFTIAANEVSSVALVEPGAPPGEDTVVVRVVDMTLSGFTGSVAGACVTLVGATGAPLFGTTNIAGNAEFDNAPAGPYTVTAQLDIPLVPSGTQRAAVSVVGVNANGNPPTILVPFFDFGVLPPTVTLDATLEGNISNPPAGLDLVFQLEEEVVGFSAAGSAAGGFSEGIPSGRAIDVAVFARDPLTGKIASGIFVADVQATPGQTLMLAFDFDAANPLLHPFDQLIDVNYTNLQAGHPTRDTELKLGDLELDVAPGFDLPDPICMPDLSRTKFVDFPARLAFSTENSALTFEESFCDLPLGLLTPATLDVPFIGPPTIVSPANNASLPTYGPGSVVDFDLGTGAGTGPGFNGITFFHEAEVEELFTFWDILVAPATTLVTLPAVFPGKPMFLQGFAAVNVETARFGLFPGFVFADFFDVNLPANVAQVEAQRVCGADRSHFFTVGLPFRAGPPDELQRRAARVRRFE